MSAFWDIILLERKTGYAHRAPAKRKVKDDGFGQLLPNQHDFGALLCEFDHAQGWVNNVAWSPDGFKIAFAGHGATISFKNLQGIIPRIPHIPHQNNYTFSFIPLIHTQFKLSSTTNF